MVINTLYHMIITSYLYEYHIHKIIHYEYPYM